MCQIPRRRQEQTIKAGRCSCQMVVSVCFGPNSRTGTRKTVWSVMRLCTGSCQTQDMDVLVLDKTMLKSEVCDSNQMFCSRISKQKSVCLPQKNVEMSRLLSLPQSCLRTKTHDIQPRRSLWEIVVWLCMTQGGRHKQSAARRRRRTPLSCLVRKRLFTALMWAAWIVLVIQLQRGSLKQRNSHAGKYCMWQPFCCDYFSFFLTELVLSLFQQNA